MRTFGGAVLSVLFVAVSSAASAQSWPERLFVSANGAFQAATNDFSDRFEFDKDLERGSTDVDYRVQSGVVFDGGVGYRLFKNFGVGVAVSVFSRSDSADTTTRSPNPFFFEQFREASGEATEMTRNETAVHIQAMYLVRLSEPLRLVLFAGPSFYTVKQDLVDEVVLTDDFPFDAVSFSTVRRQTSKATAPSFNVGADVSWMLSRGFGVGGVIRFSRASVDLDAPGNRTISVDAGGVYAGGGVRLLF
jgi:hypothetical protein